MEQEGIQEGIIDKKINTIIDIIKSKSIFLHKKIYNNCFIERKTTIDCDKVNPTGDISTFLDLMIQDELINSLKELNYFAAVITEEEESPIILNEKEGEFILTLDPLDGTSNVKINGITGTIFSIYKRISSKEEKINSEDFLQPGKNQIVSGYILYGPNLSFVYTINNKVKILLYSLCDEKFLEERHNFEMPSERPKYYSINEGYEEEFQDDTISFVKKLKSKKLSSRYSGALVADIHRILIEGGIFIYPKTEKNPNGKIRLMFESNPISLIIKAAGGAASNGKQDILEVKPDTIHQKTPIYVGTKELVNDLIKESLSYI